MNTNSNPSIQWLQDFKKRFEALWQNLKQLQVEYNQAKINFENLDVDIENPDEIIRREDIREILDEVEKELANERQKLVVLQEEYEKAFIVLETAIQWMAEKKGIVPDVSTTGGGMEKRLDEISEAYKMMLKVITFYGIESTKIAAIQRDLNLVLTMTSSEKLSGIFRHYFWFIP